MSEFKPFYPKSYFHKGEVMNRFKQLNLKTRRFWAVIAMTMIIGVIPHLASACACGCNIFDLVVPGLPDTNYETTFSLQFDYMNQNETQHGSGLVSGDLNPDKQVETSFYNLFFQHQFNRDWGFMALIPVWDRNFTTDQSGVQPGFTDASEGLTPILTSAHAWALADMRLMGEFTGLSDDMSFGIQFGLKLPTGPNDTGDFYNNQPVMDADTQPGTGTTDTLLGAYKIGNLGPSSWFVRAQWQHALYAFQGYRPGDSIDAAIGDQFHGIETTTSLIPTLEINYQFRDYDQGGGDAQFGNADSGYSNFYLTPGLQDRIDSHLLANASIYIPIYRNENGYQQVAPYLLNFGVGYQF